jgi:hypothetical protein
MKHILRVLGIPVFVLFFALPVAYAAYGEAPTFAGSTTNPPTCDNTAPKSVWPFWAKAVGSNKVYLSWEKMENVSSWTVAYGYAPGTYIWGQSNFGNDTWRSLTVNELPAGTYYFVIRGNNGCKPGPFSSEWKVTVGGGGTAFTGGQQLGASVEAAAPEVIVPPAEAPPVVDPGIIQPTVAAPPPAQLPVQVPVTPTAPAPWWQGIVDFFNGIHINY